jgi:cellulose synthase/poly-beta-1,6-N-acetylglucosamine synthase-like glycosyltransferase
MRGLEIFFWIALAIVFYAYVGYGILVFCIVKIKELFVKRSTAASTDFQPEVSLLIVAYNEEDIVDKKMENCMQIRYPIDKLNIVWVTDGSTDSTNNKLSKYNNITLFFAPERRGKTSAINRVMPFINTPITIFTDANSMLNDTAISLIVKEFNDEKVGCVAGEKKVVKSKNENMSAAGEGIYWKYESFLKDVDSRFHSAVGAAGELYAIRTSLFEEIPSKVLLDDFMLSMKIAAKGYLIRYCKTACATEQGSLNINEERKRKIRIAAGGLQSVVILFKTINPLKTPLLFFQYISHRVLRWTITPLLVFSLLPVNIVIVVINHNFIYTTLLILQIVFYLLAWKGKKMEGKNRIVIIFLVPYYFLFMNYNFFQGLIYLAKRKKGDGTWEKSQRNL